MPVAIFPDRAAWLAARSAPAPDGAPMIGASDIPAIFGLGFVSPARFAAQKRGIIARDPEPSTPSDPRAVGNRLEATALAEYVEHHSIPGEPGRLHTRITRWTHPGVPWLAVSPDALVMPDDLPSGDVLGLVQCKIPRMVSALAEYAPDRPEGYGLAATLADPRGPAIPRAYALQCLVELGVVRACGEPATWIDLWCWPSPHAHQRVRLVWDAGADAAFAALIEAVGQWRQRHIIDGEPVPVGVPDDATVAVRLWSREGQHVAPGLARVIAECAAAERTIASEEARLAFYKPMILAFMGQYEVSTLIIPDQTADPGARRRADREGKPAKALLTGSPGGKRSLRIYPGWLENVDPDDAILPPSDDITPPVPLQVPGVTVGQLAARWADRADGSPDRDAPNAAPTLSADDSALLADILGDL